MSKDDFESKTTAFLQWLAAVPGVIVNPKIEIADYRAEGGGRGAQDLFSIPREGNAILWISTSGLSSELPDLAAELDEQPWIAAILTLIYEERLGPASAWRPYLDLLPLTFDTLMFWSKDEVAELQASGIIGCIGQEAADEIFKTQLVPTVRKHAKTFNAVDLSDDELLALAHRMGSAVMAYGFDLKIGADGESDVDEEGYTWEEDDEVSETQPKAMIPLADMLNAEAEPNASLFYSPDAVTMRALRPISAGEQIFNDYGPLPRSELLRRYGYVTEGYAKFDAVAITRDQVDACITQAVGSLPADYAKRGVYFFDCMDMDCENDFGIIWPQNSDNFDFFPDALSRYVKTMVTAGPDPKAWKRVAKSGACDSQVSATFEHVARLITERRLGEYATTAAQDEELLADRDLPSRMRLAVAVRLGEKQLLLGALARLARRQGERRTEQGDAGETLLDAGDAGSPPSKKRRVGE